MNDDRIARLERLSKLRDEGVLSQEEFDVEKSRVLNSSDLATPPDPRADPTSAPINARPSLTNGWLIFGLGALVVIVLAMVAVMMWNRGGDDSVSVAEEGLQAPVVTAAPVVQQPEVAATSPARPEPMRSETIVGTVPPKITGEWRSLRTRIREGWGTEPTFADRYVIIRWGCGTGCSAGVVGDQSTGRIYDLGLGGEEQSSLTLRYGRTSNRLTARWDDWEQCVEQDFEWNGSTLLPVGEPQNRARPEGSCSAYPDWFFEED